MPKLIDYGVRFELMREAVVRLAASHGAGAVTLARVARGAEGLLRHVAAHALLTPGAADPGSRGGRTPSTSPPGHDVGTARGRGTAAEGLVGGGGSGRFSTEQMTSALHLHLRELADRGREDVT